MIDIDLYKADFLRLPLDKKFQLIFVDPPYFIDQSDGALQRPEGNEYRNVSDDDWDNFTSAEQFMTFTEAWLAKCESLLDVGGSLFLCGSFQRIFSIAALMQQRGWYFINDIIWVKTNPTPNFRGVRFTNGHEIVLWAIHNDSKKYTFNYQVMKKYNGDKQMRTEWTISSPVGKARLKDANGDTLHRAQKPEELLRRIIMATTQKGDWILDPFAGTGTTGVVAGELSRNAILVEINPEYYNAAYERLMIASESGQ